MRFVVGPTGAHLDPDLEEDLRIHELLEFLAGLGADALEALSAVADDHALVRIALDDDAGRDAAQIALFLELVDHDGRGVGQFVASQPEQLLANDFAREKLVGAVSQRVFVVEPRLLRQVGLDDDVQRLLGIVKPYLSVSASSS